jgi:hypothetical protein
MGKNDRINPSRKYANGTEHETASGKFIVLDRYLKHDFIMLKIQWLESGLIEEKKEVNISASIYKFQKNKEFKQSTLNSIEVISLQDIKESFTRLFDIIDLRTQLLNEAIKKINENKLALKKQQETIENQNKRINDILDKLIEKM